MDAGIHPQPVLAVDLDGTLIRNDVFISSSLRLVRRNPFYLLPMFACLLRGRAQGAFCGAVSGPIVCVADEVVEVTVAPIARGVDDEA